MTSNSDYEKKIKDLNGQIHKYMNNTASIYQKKIFNMDLDKKIILIPLATFAILFLFKPGFITTEDEHTYNFDKDSKKEVSYNKLFNYTLLFSTAIIFIYYCYMINVKKISFGKDTSSL
jgi:hypothetical protein